MIGGGRGPVVVALAALTVGLVAVLGSCMDSGPETFEDPSSIEVEAGEAFEVAMGANSSTGYEWKLAEPLDEEILSYAGSEYEPDPGSEDEDGGGGTQLLSFTAEGRGETTIELEYVFTGGEEKREPAETRSIEVTVG